MIRYRRSTGYRGWTGERTRLSITRPLCALFQLCPFAVFEPHYDYRAGYATNIEVEERAAFVRAEQNFGEAKVIPLVWTLGGDFEFAMLSKNLSDGFLARA